MLANATKKPISTSSSAIQETIYCDIAAMNNQQQQQQQEDRVGVADTPYSRLSLASFNSSSEAYMGLNDLASAPVSAKAGGSRREEDEDEGRSYIDLQSSPPPLEADEMYISSHFADEPLYQFYNAALIEVR